MGAFDTMMSTRVADENLRVMKPGDVWTFKAPDGWTHDVGVIRPGDSSSYLMGSPSRCGLAKDLTGHAKPGKPTCPDCLALEIPAEVVATARRETFITLRAKDLNLRRPIRHDGAVVGFCHPHDTASGFRLGPIFVLPEYRGRGLTRYAYGLYAAGKHCVAYIHDGNVGSEKAHAAAGFVKKRRGKGGWTWVREAPGKGA